MVATIQTHFVLEENKIASRSATHTKVAYMPTPGRSRDHSKTAAPGSPEADASSAEMRHMATNNVSRVAALPHSRPILEPWRAVSHNIRVGR